MTVKLVNDTKEFGMGRDVTRTVRVKVDGYGFKVLYKKNRSGGGYCILQRQTRKGWETVSTESVDRFHSSDEAIMFMVKRAPKHLITYDKRKVPWWLVKDKEEGQSRGKGSDLFVGGMKCKFCGKTIPGGIDELQEHIADEH